MPKVTLFYILFFVLLSNTILFSQSELIFKHITIEDGLPDDGVEWVMQDHLGFIWFATRVGMVKYDGYDFIQYKAGDENSVGLNQDRIRVLFEDSKGDIWGGADGYLNRYIRAKDSVVTYKSDNANPVALKGQGVYSIIEDVKGNMWFGNYRGWINYVEKPELEKEDFNIVFKQLKEENHEETHIIFNLYEDSNNIIWACTRNGLLKINKFQIEVIQAKLGKEYDRNNTFFSIIEDEKDKYWIGTYGNGLAYYNDSDKSFEFYPPGKSKFRRYDPNNILSLLVDRNGKLWCGTQGGGILKFDRNLKKYDFFWHNKNISTSLLSGYYHNLFQDNSGTIWIPVFQKGVSRIDKSLNQIQEYYYGTNNNRNIGNEIIYCFYEAKDGRIWAGTNDGIKLYDPKNRNFKKIKEIKTKYCSNRIVATQIVEDIKGHLWMHGGWDRKVWEFNPATNKIKCYGEGVNQLSSPLVSGIATDKSPFIWLSTYGGGLNRININTKEFTRYFVAGPASKKDDPEEINRMAQDTAGNLWVASYDRTLNRFDKDSETFIRKSFKEFDGGFNTTGMLIDSKNRLWLATRQAGVILYNLNNGNYRKFTVKDGLPVQDMINKFIEDNQGNVYCISAKYMMKFNNAGEFDEYYEFDIGSNNLVSANYIKSTNEIFLSTEKQVIIFQPGDIKPNPTPPNMVITDFEYFDKSLVQSFSSSSTINIAKSIELEHNQNDISITFSALHFTYSLGNQYKYILLNYEDYWHDAGNDRTAKYTNLPHGKYLFKVLGSNSDGIWTDIPAELTIIIHPPWWLTWWAYLIYAIIILSAIIVTWMMQLKRIKIKNELKMKEFEAEKLKEVDQMKSNFFANISHEFRTPLTLIKGPIERMLYDERKSGRKEVFKMMLRNTKKLLNLINELLDLSKLEAGKMKLCVGKYDIVSFTKGIVMSFKSLAESKEILLTVRSDKNFIDLYFDKEKMQKIICNLVSNALKFTSERGKISVDLKELKEKNQLAIVVKDNGVGVPEKELPKLFDRFYQVIREGSDGNTGSGIGLALTKELVLMHKGTIEVNSQIDEGTSFIVLLPLGKDHFSDDDIIMGDEKEFKFDFVELIELEENYTKVKNKPLILVVEDNDDVLKYIHDNLKKNYNVICSKNGEEGYKKAVEHIPDLIVSDIMMPVMDGNKMCELIRKDEKTSHIPVILLTAKAGEEDKIEGLETGADDYILKPFDPIELIVRIKNLIIQRNNLRQKYLHEAEVHPTEVAVTSVDKQFIEKAMRLIEENIDDPQLGIEKFAGMLSMSRSQMYRKFCAVLGEKPNDFIRKYRLKRAADLLKQDFGNVTQVAFEVGFNDPAYFAKCFKKLFKMNPFEYEKEYSRKKDLEKNKLN